METLFKEAIDYDNKVKEIKELRKTCYLMVLFFLMDDGYYIFRDAFESDIDSVLRCDERNFYVWDYESLVELFPNSKKVFAKNKFMAE